MNILSLFGFMYMPIPLSELEYRDTDTFIFTCTALIGQTGFFREWGVINHAFCN